MEQKEAIRAEGVKGPFNKQIVLQIVRSVERGATRREIIKRYGVAKSTLSGWMQQYGSPGWLASQKPLGQADRRSMVRAIEEGKMTLNEAKLAYNLKSTQAVRGYLRQAEREKAELRRLSVLMDKNEGRQEAISSEDAAALKKALEEAELKIKALNTLIDVAEEAFKIPIRKKPGARQPFE
jgi:transposase-like protein